MGFDKRTLEWDGLSLLERAALVIEQTLGEVPQLVGDNPVGSITSDSTWLPDARPDCGPLGGLVTALRDVAKRFPDSSSSNLWALVLAVDMPAVTSEDLTRLLDAMRVMCDPNPEGRHVSESGESPLAEAELDVQSSKKVICLGMEDRPEPLAALYPASTLHFWNQRLKSQRLSLRKGLKKLRVQIVEPVSGAYGLNNMNSIEDVHRNKPRICSSEL